MSKGYKQEQYLTSVLNYNDSLTNTNNKTRKSNGVKLAM